MSFIINPYSFGFNPLSLSPALWLDASDSTTLYNATTGGSLVAPDGTVARWEDKSGNARHATQATVENRPLRKTSLVNGRDILLYDSSDKLTCSLTLAPDFSVFIAGQRDNTAGSAFAGNLQNGGAFDGIVIGIFAASVNNFKAAVVRVGGSETSTPNVNIGTSAVVASVVVQPTSYTGWINGANESTVSASYNNKDTSFTIGSGRSGSTAGDSIVGKLFEVLVYPTALSTTNRQAVESYLRTKWGTP